MEVMEVMEEVIEVCLHAEVKCYCLVYTYQVNVYTELMEVAIEELVELQ